MLKKGLKRLKGNILKCATLGDITVFTFIDFPN